MLDRVKLTCFQQHRDLEVTLGQGLTAIRGANEAGKSTLLRGICYALFGAKAMPDTLEALVTWGEEVRKLKAEVDFTAEGVKYNVRRGKSGAELNYEGGKVVGQNEVTAFICKLLKVDSAAAPRLMLSNQNEIRGALEAGTKETTALIERLSNFDQLDDLIKLLGEALTTGNEATAVDRVQRLKDQLEDAENACVAPDTEALDKAVASAQDNLVAAQLDADEAYGASEAANKLLNDGRLAQAQRQAIIARAAAAEGRINSVDMLLERLFDVKAPDNVEGEIQRRREAIEAEGRRSEQQAKKDRIAQIDDERFDLNLVKAPASDVEALRAQLAAHERGHEIAEKYRTVWPHTVPQAEEVESFQGTIDELGNCIAIHEASVRTFEKKAEAARSEAALLRQQITDGSCGFCGQDFSHVPTVQAKNAELAARANALEIEAADADARAHGEWEASSRLKAINESTLPVLRALAVVGADYAQLADNFLPPVLKWVGPVYSDELADPEALRRQIQQHESDQRAYDRAQTKLQSLEAERARLAEGLPDTLPAPADVRALRKEIRELEAERDAYTAAIAKTEALEDERRQLQKQVTEAHAELDAREVVDLKPLEAQADAARAALAPARQAVSAAQIDLTAVTQALERAVTAYEQAKADVEAVKAQLAEREQELKDLRLANKLLKDVRAARPVISDKLWNLTLGAVSRYFSDMRGRPSIVTKGQDGFMVDGKVVSKVTLSGSTLDILGLAIRVALVKTFLPECPFFVLDEPSAACDSDRTINLLSFLGDCGFHQIIVASHDEHSEAIAGSVVTIGE